MTIYRGSGSAGDGALVNLVEAADLASTSDTTLGDALVGVKRTLANAVATTVHAFIEGEAIYVKRDFGATADGSTDDATAIQNAFDVGEGKTIVFEPGTYIYGSQLTYPQNAVIVGLGSATLKVAAGYAATGNCITNANANTTLDSRVHTRTIFRDLTFDGNRANRTYAGSLTNGMLDFNKTIDCAVLDCRFVDHEYIALLDRGALNTVFRGNWFTNIGRTSGTSPAIWVQSNSVDNTASTNNLTDGNFFYSCNRSAAIYSPPGGGRFVNNQIRDTGESAVFCAGPTGGGLYPTDILFAGNSIDTTTYYTSAATGFEIQEGVRVTVANNHIQNCGTMGISFLNGKNLIASGNTIRNNAQSASCPAGQESGIQLTVSSSLGTGALDNVKIRDNIFIEDQGGSATQEYCLTCNKSGSPSAPTGIEFVNNHCLNGFNTSVFLWTFSPSDDVIIAGNRGHASEAPYLIQEQTPSSTGFATYTCGFKPRLVVYDMTLNSSTIMQFTHGAIAWDDTQSGNKNIKAGAIIAADQTPLVEGSYYTGGSLIMRNTAGTNVTVGAFGAWTETGFTINWTTITHRPWLTFICYP